MEKATGYSESLVARPMVEVSGECNDESLLSTLKLSRMVIWYLGSVEISFDF